MTFLKCINSYGKIVRKAIWDCKSKRLVLEVWKSVECKVVYVSRYAILIK